MINCIPHVVLGNWSDFVAITRQIYAKGINDGVYILQKLYQEGAFYFVAVYAAPSLMLPRKTSHSGNAGGGFYQKKNIHSTSQELVFSMADK
jgi:hypothetical protein